MFIWVKKTDYQVWVGTSVSYEVVEASWAKIDSAKCPMNEWSNLFDCLVGTDGTVESIKVAIEGVFGDTSNILWKGGISPTKKLNSKLATFEGEIQFDAHKEAITKNGMGADINNKCLTAIENLTNRVNVVERLNSEELAIKRNQEIA